jgi:hypothetical protein
MRGPASLVARCFLRAEHQLSDAQARSIRTPTMTRITYCYSIRLGWASHLHAGSTISQRAVRVHCATRSALTPCSSTASGCSMANTIRISTKAGGRCSTGSCPPRRRRWQGPRSTSARHGTHHAGGSANPSATRSGHRRAGHPYPAARRGAPAVRGAPVQCSGPDEL